MKTVNRAIFGLILLLFLGVTLSSCNLFSSGNKKCIPCRSSKNIMIDELDHTSRKLLMT